MKRLTILAAVALLAATSATQAHPGHSSLPTSRPTGSGRVWTAADGAILDQGDFVSLANGWVQVRHADDSLAMVRLEALCPADRAWVDARQQQIAALANMAQTNIAQQHAAHADAVPAVFPVLAMNLAAAEPEPAIASAFAPYVKLKAIKTRWDADHFYVESNGFPDHPMMVGITAWQQQVPIPQKYTGDNAWRIPLKPVPAKTPQSAKGNFLRGAIALAVNGVPIFNPLNNRGDDAFLFGELDEYGGHCGRADDYHYHIAPIHLQKVVGRNQPIGYALDGYPIYGYDEPDGSPVKALDALNGHKDANGNYHYHATKKYPYLNGGFYGEVIERNGQVDPQPSARPLRPALPPMRGAKITAFTETKPGSYRLTYEVEGKKGFVNYTLAADGSAKFEFIDTAGKSTTQDYAPGNRRPGEGNGPPREGDRPPRDGNGPPRNGDRPPRNGQGQGRPRDDDRPPPREGQPPAGQQPNGPPRGGEPQARQAVPPVLKGGLTLSSASLDARCRLNVDCTCDGKRQSPAVEWKGAPAGTKSFVVSVWHVAPDNVEKSYWVVYRIPANVTQLPQGMQNIGTLGLNDRKRAEYDPMCSKGPGLKTYHVTVYALSAEPNVSPEKASRAELLAAIKDITLADGTLDFIYERPATK